MVDVVQIPVVDTKNNKMITIDMDIQLPHEVFFHYSNQGSYDFNQVFGSPQEILQFWKQKDLRDAAYAKHPAISRPDFHKFCIPCKLHSDGAVLTRHDSLHIASWSSFFAKGSLLENQRYFTSIVKAAEHPDSWPILFKILAWSFEACLRGTHPCTDWNGQEFPPNSRRQKLSNKPLNKDGYFLGMFMITADMEEICNMYGLRHFNSNNCCFRCKANTTTIPWTDLSPDAKWRSTTETWTNTQHPPTSHKIWDIPGLSMFSISWDVLHGLDQGPSLHVCGNLLDDLVHLKVLGKNQDVNGGK